MNEKPNVLLCDDDPSLLEITSGILERAGFNTRTCSSGANCLAELERGLPDVLLLDVDMPGQNGYETCQAIRTRFPKANLPILFLTSNKGTAYEKRAFETGGQDFVSKPIAPEILIARTKTHCEIKKQRDILENSERILQEQVAAKTQSIVTLQNITIFALTTLCGERDQETGSHIIRTQLYVLALSKALQPTSPELTREKTDAIFRYAPLHDIGKIGIPDKILLKPGKLSPEEFDVIKTHTVIGHRSLVGAQAAANSPIPELDTAKNIVRSHHEKWNGSGYPDKLAGTAIPLEARIMAIADVYDALRSKRVYKDAMPHKKACEILTADAGTHFDPKAIAAFLKVAGRFEDISQEYETTSEELEEQQSRIERA